jgi:hypothetical protein
MLHINIEVTLSTLPVYLPTYLSVCLSVCLSACLIIKQTRKNGGIGDGEIKGGGIGEGEIGFV